MPIFRNTGHYGVHFALLVLLAIPLSGCAALYTSIVESELRVSSKLSETIFLDPVPEAQKSVYLEIKNTSDVPNLRLRDIVASKIRGSGYRIIDDPDKAHYWLQANILYVGETSITAAEAAFEDGFGAPLATGIATATAGAFAGLEEDEAFVLGLAASAVSALTDWVVRSVNISVITDIRLAEYSDNSVRVREDLRLSQGAGGVITQRGNRRAQRKKYEARILTTAQQANLTVEEATPEIITSLSEVIGGLF